MAEYANALFFFTNLGLIFSTSFIAYDLSYFLLVMAGHFKKTPTIYDHLIKVKRETHVLVINMALVLAVIVINKMVSDSKRLHIRVKPYLIKIDSFK